MRQRIDYFAAGSELKELKKKTLRAGASMGTAQGIAIVVQLITVPILSRLLAPADFGIVAAATVFTGFAQLFVDAGLSSATIQRDKITPQQSSNLFWFATTIGVVLTLLMLAAAVPLGWVFRNREVALAAAALASTFTLSGLNVQHAALLRRTMRFTTLSVIQVTATVTSQAAMIGLAWRYETYWALVAGPITYSLVSLLGVWATCHWRPGLPKKSVGTRSMVEFGTSISAAKLLNYASRSVDRLLIGSVLGEVALGYYERAARVLLVPIQNINNPLTSVLLPTLSRLVDQPKRYAQAYFSAIRAVAAVSLPLVAYAAIDADRIIPFMLGEQWADSVPLFRAMTPAAFAGVFSSVFSWVFVSYGRGTDLIRWQAFVGVLSLACFAIGISWGVLGVAIAFSASRVLLVPVGVWMAFAGTPLTSGQLLRTLAPVIASLVPAAAVALYAKANYEFFGGSGFFAMTALVGLILGVYGVLAFSLGVHRLRAIPLAT